MTTTAETATLAWGYTMADLERLTHRVADGYKSFGLRVLSYADIYENAWFGVVERLYASSERPASAVLLEAGRKAVGHQLNKHSQHHGLQWKEGELVSRPSFDKYWRTVARSDHDFTDRLADRLALPQVLALLTTKQYEAIAALAAHGSLDAAADALGLDYRTYYQRVARAREKILTAWLSPEHPPTRPNGRGDTCKAGHPRAKYGFYEGTAIRCKKCRARVDRRGRERRASAKAAA